MRDESNSTAIDQAFSLPSLSQYSFEHSPLPMLAVEGAARVVRYVNLAFSQLAGKQEEELIGIPLSKAVREGVVNGCLDAVDRVFRTGRPENLAEQKHRAVRPTYWSYVMWPIAGTDGRPTGVMIQVTDVTETAVFRELVAEMNGALIVSSVREHENSESMERLNGRLQVAIGHKDHFMAVLSHELRPPLAPILGALAILRQDLRFDVDTREMLEMIDRNVTLEARLIDDLLDMTRIERGEIPLERSPVDLRLVVDRAVEVCRPAAKAGNVTLEVNRRGEPYLVDADPGRLQQVFWNLLRNAIKFSPEGSRVRVRYRRSDDSRVVVEVDDDGVGIEPDFVPIVFNAFQQGDRDQVRKFGGLGLGLAISKTIIDLHGGVIAASSEGKGRGATFTVELPIVVDTRSVLSSEETGVSAARFPLRSLRVLLVEDHEDTALMMRRILATEGHELQWAASVTAALKLAAEQSFDLILSDLNLPDGSGHDLIRQLRNQGVTLPAIALSGYGKEQDVDQSLAAGFDIHLTKPVGLKALLATIAKVVRNRDGR